MLLINGDLSIGFIHIQISTWTNHLLSNRVGVRIHTVEKILPTIQRTHLRYACLRMIYMPTNQIHLKLPTNGKLIPYYLYNWSISRSTKYEKGALFGTIYLNHCILTRDARTGPISELSELSKTLNDLKWHLHHLSS